MQRVSAVFFKGSIKQWLPQSTFVATRKYAAQPKVDQLFLDRSNLTVPSEIKKVSFFNLCQYYKVPASERAWINYSYLLPFLKSIVTSGVEKYALILASVFSSHQAAVNYFKQVEVNLSHSEGVTLKRIFEEAMLKITLPQSPGWNIELWQALAEKYLSSKVFKEIFKYAKEIEQYVQWNQAQLKLNLNEEITAKLKKEGKYSDRIIRNSCLNAHRHLLSVHTSLAALTRYGAMVAFKNANQHPDAAILFFKLGIEEKYFDQYLSLKPCDDDELLPPVVIAGDALKQPAYKLQKLSSVSPLAAVLGKFTSCCQTLGDVDGDKVVRYGIEQPNSGFYIVKRLKDDVIVAQCWAWRNPQTRNIVFDSIETYQSYKTGCRLEFICELFTLLAKTLVKEHHVPQVLVGTGGSTPPMIGKSANMDQYANLLKGSDAKKGQRLLAAESSVSEDEYESFVDSRLKYK